jgi:hypothetical protein
MTTDVRYYGDNLDIFRRLPCRAPARASEDLNR